jgi:hypothetical protein
MPSDSGDLGSTVQCGSGATKGEPEATCAAVTSGALSQF